MRYMNVVAVTSDGRRWKCSALLLLCLACCLSPGLVMAQGQNPLLSRPTQQVPGPARTTGTDTPFSLEIEILIQPLPSYRINAQRWGRVFQELGYVVRFREGRPGEKTRAEDIVDTGGSRTTRVVGLMEADGRIFMMGQKFQDTAPQAMTELFERLRIWGAAGPPSSSPTWGLTDAQFTVVTQLMSAPVEADVVLQSPIEAIDSLKLPDVFQLRFTEKARERAFLKIEDSSTPTPDLKGISKGTGLAVALAQFGLGFRPLQNPDAGGGFVLEVDTGDESSNLWPVGWKTTQPLVTLLPGLYRSISVDVEDVVAGDLIQLLADNLKIPMYQSTAALKAAGLNLSQLRYSRKPDKVSPSRLMLLLGDRFQMGLDVRTDEAGHCFLWVTSRSDFLAWRQRFAHVVPGRP